MQSFDCAQITFCTALVKTIKDVYNTIMVSLTTTSLLLGGMAAAAVPVLLHLLMQGKPKVIEFPAVMFILQKIEVHRRNYRLKHILLLVMRILLFSLLGLALARPMLKLGDGLPFFGGSNGMVSQLVSTFGSQDAPIAAAIVVDTSIRMNYIAENKTRLEEAQEFAQWILRQIPQNSSVAILSCEPEAPVFQVDKLAAEGAIDRLRITPMGRPVAEVVQGAAALLLESELEHRELYVLSDISVPGWNVSVGSDALHRLDGEIFVVDVSVPEPSNSSFQQFTLVPETPIANTPVHFEVQVAHSGPATTKTVELVLIGTAHDPKAETVRTSRTIDFSDGKSQRTVPMTLTGGFEPGMQQGKLRFLTSDALPMDDQMWFTLSVQQPQKVLIFAQPPVRESSIYLQEALETIPFAVATAPMSDLAGMTMTELQEHQAVLLLDPDALSLSAGTWQKLADYADAGYGVGTFLGERSIDFPLSFNETTATDVLGAKLVREARSPEGAWIVPGVSPVFTPFRAHGLLEEFPWFALPVFRYWELGELSHRADIAAKFSDNRPAIITQTLGRGRSVLVATPVSETADTERLWNGLTRGEVAWMWVLLAEGIAKHLVGIGSQAANFTVGESVVLRPNVSALPSSCLLGTPQGTSERITPDPIRREIVISATTEPGNYTVRAGGLGEAALNLGFSANIPASATVLQRVDGAVLDRLFGADAYQVVRTPQEIVFGTARRRVGQEIYAVIMLLLACIFATEYVFANRIYGGSHSGETT